MNVLGLDSVTSHQHGGQLPTVSAPDLDQRTQETAFSRFKNTVYTAVSSLAHRVVTAGYAVAAWFNKLIQWLLSLFKSNQADNVPANNSESTPVDHREPEVVADPEIDELFFVPQRMDEEILPHSLVEGDDLVQFDEDQIVPKPDQRDDPLDVAVRDDSDLELVPFKASLPMELFVRERPLVRNSLNAPTLSAQLRKAPQLRFAIVHTVYKLDNPVFQRSYIQPQAALEFRRLFMEMLEKAAEQPHFDIQVGDELFIRIFNPGYQRSIKGNELYRHTVHQLQSIMSSTSTQALTQYTDNQTGHHLVSVKQHEGACPCRFCVQNNAVVGASHFELTIGDESFQLENPFRNGKPSDDQVHNYQLALGRILARASEEKQFSIGLGNSPKVNIVIDGDQPITPATFGQALLVIADARRVSEIAEMALDEPMLLPGPIERLEVESSSGIVKIARNRMDVIHQPVEGKIEVYQKSEGAPTTLEDIAASVYLEEFIEIDCPQAKFPLFASYMPELETGRNLLLNYVDELSTVWNAHPLTLGYAVQYCVELSKSGLPITQVQKDQIRFFFSKLKAASHFDLPFYLSGKEELQRILSPRLDTLLANPAPNRNQKLEIDLARAELATSFGFGIVPTQGGKNGAVFIQTFEGRSVGVFKAPPELGVFDIIERMKQYFGQARLLSSKPMAQEYAEVVAADMSRFFGFKNIAPEAIMAKFGGAEGAFISFLDGYRELSKIKPQFEARESYEDHEIEMWQMKEIWNKLIHNLDPHDDNVFVIADPQSTVLQKICMIDHGNSFPEHNPGTFGSRGNMAASSTFKISQIPFREQVRNFISSQINEEMFERFLGENAKHSEFFTDKMKRLQLERIKLLKLVADGTIKTPVELMAIQTDRDYQHYLSANKY